MCKHNFRIHFVFFSFYLLKLFGKDIQEHFFRLSPFLFYLILLYTIESLLLQKFQQHSRERCDFPEFVLWLMRFTDVSAFISSISYTSDAAMMYFFALAIHPPVITFKREPTKLPRTGPNKGAKKVSPSCTKGSFLFFCDVLRFTSSGILSRFLLIFLSLDHSLKYFC